MRISFIGFGRVASTTAYSLLIKDPSLEIEAYDIDSKRLEAEILDLTHAFPNSIIESKNIEDMQGELIIITAGIPRKPGMTREELVEMNIEIIDSFVDKIPKDSFVIVVSNPVDVLTTYLAKKRDPKKVFGFGSLLDSHRYSKHGGSIVIGQHGEHFVPIGGNDSVVNKIKDENMKVIEGKGGTQFAPARLLAETVIGIRDKIETTGSVLLKGEYGVRDIAIGVPVIIEDYGIKEVKEIELNEWEKKRFERGVFAIKELVDKHLKVG